MTRILLVEDDEDVRPLMEHVLLTASYQVDSAVTVRSAFALLARHSYDLVVADGRLPDGTGLMAADRAAQKGVKALIVTAYAFQLPREELLRYPYLLKPVRPDELLRAIERTLGQSPNFEQVEKKAVEWGTIHMNRRAGDRRAGDRRARDRRAGRAEDRYGGGRDPRQTKDRRAGGRRVSDRRVAGDG